MQSVGKCFPIEYSGTCFFNICELIRKFTVKHIELAIDIPITPINFDKTMLKKIFAATANIPVIIGPLVSLYEYSTLITISLTPELVKPMAYPINAALVKTRECSLKLPLKYAIETISLEHIQVIIVIGTIRQIIIFMADFMVDISFSLLFSATYVEKLTYKISTTLLINILQTKSSKETARDNAVAVPYTRPVETELSTILLICPTELPINSGKAVMRTCFTSGTFENLVNVNLKYLRPRINSSEPKII